MSIVANENSYNNKDVYNIDCNNIPSLPEFRLIGFNLCKLALASIPNII